MKFILAFALCLSLAVSATAAKPKKPAAKGSDAAFKKADTNGDGIITPREFGAISKDVKNVGKAFSKLDVDKSGSLLPSEFSAYKPENQDKAKKKKKK